MSFKGFFNTIFVCNGVLASDAGLDKEREACAGLPIARLASLILDTPSRNSLSSIHPIARHSKGQSYNNTHVHCIF